MGLANGLVNCLVKRLQIDCSIYSQTGNPAVLVNVVLRVKLLDFETGSKISYMDYNCSCRLQNRLFFLQVPVSLEQPSTQHYFGQSVSYRLSELLPSLLPTYFASALSFPLARRHHLWLAQAVDPLLRTSAHQTSLPADMDLVLQ